MTQTTPQTKSYKGLIVAISIAIPIVVAVLYLLPAPDHISPELRSFLNNLPGLNALINGTTFLVLISALLAIKNKKVILHRRLMTLALVLSALFLVSYVAYHLTSPSTSYGGEGFMKGLYLFILLTHILLSAAIVPLVLISYARGLAARYDKHRKIARITLPIWLYVALTGVLVYMMISPYYPFNS